MSTPTLREAAERLVRWHLDNAEVHPCDVNNDDIRADQCISEVRDLRAALAATAAPDGWVNEVMEQAQAFASAWSLVGSRFDKGCEMANAEEAKAELRAMLTAAPRPAPAEPAVPDGVWEALQRMIEDGLAKGSASRDDALAVARHRDRVRFMATPAQQPAGGELDARKAAEHAYITTAFNYAEAPVGSRDWCLFWKGWHARAAQPQPTMSDALAAGDDTLHGAIDHWQERALKAEAALAQAGQGEPVATVYRGGTPQFGYATIMQCWHPAADQMHAYARSALAAQAAEVEALRAVLAELVALNDLEAAIEMWVIDTVTGKQWPKMQPYEARMAACDDYKKRKPLALAAARAALKEPGA